MLFVAQRKERGKPAAIFFVNLLLCELGFGVGEGVGDVAVVLVAGVEVAAGLCGRIESGILSEGGGGMGDVSLFLVQIERERTNVGASPPLSSSSYREYPSFLYLA